MEKHFNGLTPAEAERLALIMEEAGEVVQVIGKILRHGYESFSPFDQEQTTNRALLEREIGDLEWAVNLAATFGDISHQAVARARCSKGEKVCKYLHHNDLTE